MIHHRMISVVWLSEILVIIIQSEISSSKSGQRLYKGFQNCIQDLWPYNILFFPFGEDGYQTNISFASQDDQLSRKHQNVLMRAFYAYFIHEREYGEDNVTKGG